MNLTDLRVKTRLMLAFAFLAAIVLAVSAPSLRSLGASSERFASCLTSAAAESLEQQAAGLPGLVAAFKTADRRAVAFG